MDYRELLRKSVHLLGLSYIPAYEILGRGGMVIAVGTITLFAIILEVLRHRFGIIPEFLLRNYEKKGVGAYVYFGIATFIITVTLPKNACFVGVVVGSLGDGVSGILKHAFKLSGLWASLGMLIVSVFGIYILDLLSIRSLLAVIAGVAVERVERIGGYHINDNLSVPLVSAFAHRALEIVL